MEESEFKDKFRQRAPASPCGSEEAPTDPPPTHFIPGFDPKKISVDFNLPDLHPEDSKRLSAIVAEVAGKYDFSIRNEVKLCWKSRRDGEYYAAIVAHCEEHSGVDDFCPRVTLDVVFTIPGETETYQDLLGMIGEKAFLKLGTETHEIQFLQREPAQIAEDKVNLRITARVTGRIS